MDRTPGFFNGLQGRLIRLSRSRKAALLACVDAAAMPAIFWLSLSLKYGQDLGATDLGSLRWAFPLVSILVLVFGGWFGLYRVSVRYMGDRTSYRIAETALAVSLTFGMVVWVSGSTLIRPTGLAIFCLLTVLYLSGSRYLARQILKVARQYETRAVIYGAGEAGTQLARALSASASCQPVAFVDDSPQLQGMIVQGLKVYRQADIRWMKSELGVNKVLLALPSSTSSRRAEIVKALEDYSLHVQTVPSISDIVSGRARVEQIRDINVAELLGRDSIEPLPELMQTSIYRKSVLVTGAGGSIGSELCRQILKLNPRQLVLIDHSELALYTIKQELAELSLHPHIQTRIVGLLGSVCERQRLRQVLNVYGIETVYHAAAYKHVPIVEENVISGVENNIMGTYRCAEESRRAGVETFVFISTDKAVHPINVMGATKRFAELVLEGLANEGGDTRFCMVRFGNVLDSSGSVVPLFQQQIKEGGPVTVTHPDVTRFFMTIPEAAQLVLQAGAMARGGEVFLLDMGKPVRIADLAKRMITLAGLQVRDEDNSQGDIEIRYIGLRPAEKLYEELLIEPGAVSTAHPRIMKAVETARPWPDVQVYLEQLKHCVAAMDANQAWVLLHEAMAEYRESCEDRDLIWGELQRRGSQPPAGALTTLEIHRARVVKH